MAENRLARDAESRAQAERPKRWQPADLLPEPDKNPDYVYRWVRVSMLNSADPRNISSKLREGWEPVPIEEQPKFRLFLDPQSRFKDCIEVGGLLLCKTPKEFVQQRNEYYHVQTQKQMEAVDNNLMRQNDPRMPLFKERKSSTSFGSGK